MGVETGADTSGGGRRKGGAGEGGLEPFGSDPGKVWGGQVSKLAIVSRYRYAIAFENSAGLDYVTEKVYEVLASGSIPIYLGAPNIRDFVPHSGAILHAKDFATPAALGERLHAIDADEGAWLRHHAWRSAPVPRAFEDLQYIANLTALPLVCRLCACVAGHLGCDSGQ